MNKMPVRSCLFSNEGLQIDTFRFADLPQRPDFGTVLVLICLLLTVSRASDAFWCHKRVDSEACP